MSIYGPNVKSDGTDPVGNVDLSLYAKKAQVLSKMGGRMTGRINMQDKKITDVGNPENGGDVASKQYVDEKASFRISSLGRYVVVEGENKKYFSVRARKNIDLAGGLQVELKNSLADSDENESNALPRNITIQTQFELLPNLNKKLGFSRINREISSINFKSGNYLAQPWVLLFSAKLGNTFPRLTLQISTKQSDTSLLILLEANIIKYAITQDVNNSSHATAFNVDTTQFNHVTFEYVDNKLTTWLNGEQKRMHDNAPLNRMSEIRIGGSGDLGILSLYNKDLNKQEIVQHFVDYHVSNFTNDEVLI